MPSKEVLVMRIQNTIELANSTGSLSDSQRTVYAQAPAAMLSICIHQYFMESHCDRAISSISLGAHARCVRSNKCRRCAGAAPVRYRSPSYPQALILAQNANFL